MIFSSGVPDKLTVNNASDFIKSVDDDITRLVVLRDELKAYQEAKITIDNASVVKAEADAYVTKVKTEIDVLKASTTEKLNKAKKREADAEALNISLKNERDQIQAEKDAAEKEISKMWDTLKADIVKLNNDQADVLTKQTKYDQDRAELDARIAKFQATVASMTQ